MEPFRAGAEEPLGNRLISGIAAIAIVIPRTHHQSRLSLQKAEILLNDRDLHIAIKPCTKVQQVPVDHGCAVIGNGDKSQ